MIPPATRRSARLRLPERPIDATGRTVADLEDEIAEFAAGRPIAFSLTSADTAAFPPPPYFLEGVARAIRDGRPGYTALRGDLAVRSLLAPRLAALLGVAVDPEREVLLTAGTQSALFATLATLVQAGDKILVADPEYLCDERVARFFGAEVLRVPFVRRGCAASLDLDVLEDGLQAGARTIVFSNPHNPTGSVMSAASLARIAELAVAYDAVVVADELYARFVYDGEMTHIAALPGMRDRCLTALGPSKTESASGYRIGVLVGPAALLDRVVEVIEITTVRAPAYSQYALERWLDGDAPLIRAMVERYRALRAMTLERFAEMPGVVAEAPAATAWLFPDLSGLGLDDGAIVRRLIKAGVMVMPGLSFGPSGAGCVRLCFGQDIARFDECLDRIAAALAPESVAAAGV